MEGDMSDLLSTHIWVQGVQLLDVVKKYATLHNYAFIMNLIQQCFWIGWLFLELPQSYQTFRWLVANLYWPGMSVMVQQFVKAYYICQRCKASSTTQGGLLQPLPIPTAIWEDVPLEFNYYGPFLLLKHPYTAKSVADFFVKEVIRHHGIPKSLESFRLQETTLRMSSAYHLEFDGQTEFINRCLEAYLRCFVVDQPRNRVVRVTWAGFRYNSMFHRYTGMSPFEVLYGRKPPNAKSEFRRDEALRQLKQHLAHAHAVTKEYAYMRRQSINFQVRVRVYVKLKSYKQISVAQGIRLVASKLYPPPSSKIDYVFHVSLLQIIFHAPVDLNWRSLQISASYVSIPITILASRDTVKDKDLSTHGIDAIEEVTWEDVLTIQSQYPNFSLEDNTVLAGGVMMRMLIYWDIKSRAQKYSWYILEWERDHWKAWLKKLRIDYSDQFSYFSLEDKTVLTGGSNDDNVKLLGYQEHNPKY
ncbi:hypothetical protein LXL04_016138 [Taraxacum kok-saghyz]